MPTPDELAAALSAAIDQRTVELGDVFAEFVSHKHGQGWVTAVLYDDSCLDLESEVCRVRISIEVQA